MWILEQPRLWRSWADGCISIAESIRILAAALDISRMMMWPASVMWQVVAMGSFPSGHPYKHFHTEYTSSYATSKNFNHNRLLLWRGLVTRYGDTCKKPCYSLPASNPCQRSVWVGRLPNVCMASDYQGNPIAFQHTIDAKDTVEYTPWFSPTLVPPILGTILPSAIWLRLLRQF
jgi:hypothetical protein